MKTCNQIAQAKAVPVAVIAYEAIARQIDVASDAFKGEVGRGMSGSLQTHGRSVQAGLRSRRGVGLPLPPLTRHRSPLTGHPSTPTGH